MGERHFSVGKIKRGDGSYVGVCTGIVVRYDGNPQEFRGGDYRYPLDIEPGDQSLIVTAETADYDAAEPTFGVSETLELEAGAQGGGIIVTLINMVLVTGEITSGQNSFVGSRLEWRRKDVEV